MLNDPNDNNNDKLFSSSDGDKNPNAPKSGDDYISESFAVSFKANEDANSVSEKLQQEASKPSRDTTWEDEFDNFEFDSSVSAFKPLAAQPKAEEPKKEEPKTEATKKETPKVEEKIEKPQFPTKEGGDFDDPKPKADAAAAKEPEAPLFDDSDKDLMGFAGAASQQGLFTSGDNLDFATSASDGAESTFAHAEKPEVVTNTKLDVPSQNSNEPKVKAYGQVSSGVNAFKKPEEKPAPQKAEAKSETDTKKTVAAAGAAAATTAAATAASKAAIKPENKPTSNAGRVLRQDNNSTIPAKKEAPATEAKKAEPDKKEEAKTATKAAAAAGAVTTAQTHRPGSSSDAFKKPTPSDVKAKSQAYTSSAQRASNNISPVTTSDVKKKKKKKEKKQKEPGKSGLITLVVVIAIFMGMIWLLDNSAKIKSLFNGGQSDVVTTQETTRATTTTATTTEETTTEEEATATTTEKETTTTTADEEETEETTKETTEETSEETTTEETTEEETTTTTTEETTTTTTTEAATTTTTTEETTTTTTTEATTTTTTTAEETTTTTAAASSSEGVKVTNFDAKLKGFKTTSGGFSFNIYLKNKSDKDASLTKSLKSVTFTLYADKTIKDVTSEYFTFSHSGSSYTAKPTELTIPAGESVSIKVSVSTSGSVSHYGYKSGSFNWK